MFIWQQIFLFVFKQQGQVMIMLVIMLLGLPNTTVKTKQNTTKKKRNILIVEKQPIKNGKGGSH